MNVLAGESLDQLFSETLNTVQWKLLQKDFNSASLVFIIGNGGNLAVADHGAIDITRLSSKLSVAPGSGILATSIIGDSSVDSWFSNWIKAHVTALSPSTFNNSIIIGISSSGTAKNIVDCLKLSATYGIKAHMLSTRRLTEAQTIKEINTIQLGSDYYHTGEVLSLLLIYQLIHGSGKECPSISSKINAPSFDRLLNNIS